MVAFVKFVGPALVVANEVEQGLFSTLGVSKRTLEQWEQERREPSQAAQRLVQIAILRPDVLIELFGDAA